MVLWWNCSPFFHYPDYSEEKMDSRILEILRKIRDEEKGGKNESK